MKRSKLLIVLLTLMLISQLSFGQGQSQRFKMVGSDPVTVMLNQTITENMEILPFDKNVNQVFGLAVSADIKLVDETSVVRLILIDKNFEEYLIYETYNLLADEIGEFSIDEICEETSVLNNVKVHSVRIEIVNASVKLKSITYTRAIGQGVNFEKVKKEKKQDQNEVKIKQINKNLKEKGMNWFAGHTKVSELTYSEKKKLYGQSTFPAGFEYYAGGVISTATGGDQLKSATAGSLYVDNWDWRDRHGKNWISPIADQGACGSCWAFAATGATEAMVNVYFNQILNLNLSEQDLLSCSGGGNCGGGYPSMALDYIKNTGVVDEGTFTYNGTNQPCENKSSNSSELIKIGGRLNYGYSEYPKEEDVLKRMLIEHGPLSGGLYDWSHAIVLVGYKVVKGGDKFFYRDLNLTRSWYTVNAGDPLIGKTVWIFKNSWGADFGDEGYVYVETPVSNMSWTHAIVTPITSVVNNYKVICEDRDGDGYFWWGLGPKPATCGGPDTPDGNDVDPALGPLDEYGYCTVISGAPVVSISADKTSIKNGESVNFTDLSTNNPTSWAWSFNGGNPSASTSKNPIVAYTSAGNYNVSLTVVNAKGTSTKTFTNYITVLEPVIQPVANFTTDKSTITSGELVTFTDLSVNNPTLWLWTFNGGNPSTSTLQNPKVTYTTPGTYSVSLLVTNAAGSGTKTTSNYIKVNEIIPAYCVSSGNATNEWIASVKLGAQTNNSLSSGTTGYQDFTGKIFTADAGSNQNVVLTPKFSGAAKREFWRIWIDYNGDMDFNDSNEQVYASSASSKVVTGTFTIPAGLNLTTRMRVSMKRSSAASQCEIFSPGEVEDYTISIGVPAPQPLVAEFAAVKTNVKVGESVQFTDLSENGPTQWEWLFPGGNPSASNVRNPIVTYEAAGQYDVSLTVSKSGFDPIKKVKQKYIVSVENIYTDYCVPTGIKSSSDYIQNAVIGGAISNSTGGDSYSLSANTVTMVPGQAYNISLTPKVSTNRNFWKIWIDFNKDGDFTDADEVLINVANKKGTITTELVIPQYATGITRMRVAMRNSSEPSPCDDNFEGEVEDYPVSFETAASSGISSLTGEIAKYPGANTTNFGMSVTTVENIEFSNSESFSIYPNPFSNILNIWLDTVESGDSYSIFTINGKKVLTEQIISPLTSVDLTGFSSGIYLMKVVNGKHVYSEKVIKK